MAVTVVPNRNMILLAIAAAKAQDLSVDVVGFGAHAGDHAIYPDCRVEFIEKLDLAINYATEGKVQIFAPFTGVTKADIVKRGVELGVPFELTWTCYKGGDLACGRCGTCVERLEAFEIAGAVDPLEYEDREFWQSVVRVH
jgi:7-cyano-7-deazaguanine synthase